MTASALLRHLATVQTASVEVRSPTSGGTGSGRVAVSHDGDVLVLTETGEWTPHGHRPLRWRAVSRWHTEREALVVEHVRQGTPARAVLDAVDGQWVARSTHLCGDDRYDAALATDGDALVLTWTISGPCKQAVLVTRYA